MEVAFDGHSEGMRSASEENGDFSVKVVVDFDTCDGNGVCMSICPEVFEVKDDGFLYLLQDEPGEELRDKVEGSVVSCPTQAITVEE